MEGNMELMRLMIRRRAEDCFFFFCFLTAGELGAEGGRSEGGVESLRCMAVMVM